jgi:hypothetical protein
MSKDRQTLYFLHHTESWSKVAQPEPEQPEQPETCECPDCGGSGKEIIGRDVFDCGRCNGVGELFI